MKRRLKQPIGRLALALTIEPPEPGNFGLSKQTVRGARVCARCLRDLAGPSTIYAYLSARQSRQQCRKGGGRRPPSGVVVALPGVRHSGILVRSTNRPALDMRSCEDAEGRGQILNRRGGRRVAGGPLHGRTRHAGNAGRRTGSATMWPFRRSQQGTHLRTAYVTSYCRQEHEELVVQRF